MDVHCILFILLSLSYSRPCLPRSFIPINISCLCSPSVWLRFWFCLPQKSQFKFSQIKNRKILLAVVVVPDETLLTCKAQTACSCFGENIGLILTDLFHYYVCLVHSVLFICIFFDSTHCSVIHCVNGCELLLMFFTGNDVCVNVTAHITKHTTIGLLHSNHKVTLSGGFVKCNITKMGQGHLQNGWLLVIVLLEELTVFYQR